MGILKIFSKALINLATSKGLWSYVFKSWPWTLHGKISRTNNIYHIVYYTVYYWVILNKRLEKYTYTTYRKKDQIEYRNITYRKTKN